ncbi:endolytic transglycosylase MltG [Actinoplanes sp. N902-109]|uniref:endolytic transglycosylase MltG n=1 Tax=Actinoplanes sp. (strain N902-109) TaxID=649831 RepID=UPI000329572F|nr:endolytic transglycosylase MltG [Actinoplanes sp. N902-109]AGL19454.1 aminodeoxychorismate lyase [Actinoplanes sp. N902-109]
MIDELDLAFDEQAERGKPRHRRGARGAKGGRGKTGIAFLMAFVLLGVLGVGGYLGYEKVKGFFTAADYDGAGGEAVQVTIADNATLTDIGNTLVGADVVKSTAAFTEAADANPKGKNIQSGTYNLKKQMSGKAAVELLLDPKSRVTNGVTFAEGLTSFQIYDKLAKATGLKVADFKAAAKDPEALGIPDFWFNRTDGQKVTKSVEGFLFPDTYEFPPKGTAESYLKIMIEHFMKVAEDTDFVKKAESDRHISPYEVLTVASLSQKEAGNTADLGKVSRVAYNRLYVQKPPMPLEYDVGINYYYALTGRPTKTSGQMTTEELRDPKNPYRLHGKAGLTPTPISNPGKAALEGALEPPAGNWLYFVAIDKQKHSAFTNDYQQHLKNIETAKKNGVL